MKSKNTSRLLTDCVLLVALAILSVFSFRLFKEEKKKYEDTVKEMMTSSNYKETVLRFQSVGAGGQLMSSGLQMSSPTSSIGGRKPVIYLYKRVINDSTAAGKDKKSGDDFDKIFKKAGDSQDDISSTLTAGINSAIKALRDVDFNAYDSILVASLKEKGIETPYQLELLYADSTDLNKITATPGFKRPKLVYSFSNELIIDGDEGKVKYVYSSAPFGYVISKMAALLILSGIAFIIIVISLITLSKSTAAAKRTAALQEEFTHLVTHNMNNPLAIICASMQAVESNMGENISPQCKQYFTIINRQAANLSDQVKSILNPYRLSKVDGNFKKESVKLVATVRGIVSQFEIANPEVSFEMKSDIPDETCIGTNEKMFDEMVCNLIQNAVKYTPKNPHIEVSLSSDTGNIVISVKDNGVGIPDDKIKNLFERYYKVEALSSTPGYGIGLYFVKQVADLHQWVISVDSKVGEGSTFSILIPE